MEDKVAAEYERIARYDRVAREYGSYVNKYRDAQSPLEVKLSFSREKPGRKRAEVQPVQVPRFSLAQASAFSHAPRLHACAFAFARDLCQVCASSPSRVLRANPRVLQRKLMNQPGMLECKLTWCGWQQKWKKWDLQQSQTLQTLAAYLFRIEKELRGLIDGPWLTSSGRTNWSELVKGASDVNDISLAAVQLEAALKSVALDKTWFTAEEAAVKRRGRRGRPKKLSEKVEKKAVEYDWEEMRKAEIIEDTTIGGEEEEDEDDKEPVCWVGGNRVVPCELYSLSTRSLRCAILTGELVCFEPGCLACSQPHLLDWSAGLAVSPCERQGFGALAGGGTYTMNLGKALTPSTESF